MGACQLSAGRGRVWSHLVRVLDCRDDRIAALGMERLADATPPRASAARAIAVRFNAVLVPCGRRAVARLGNGAWLCGTIVHDPAVDRDPEGEGRYPPLVGSDSRVYRCADHHPSRR